MTGALEKKLNGHGADLTHVVKVISHLIIFILKFFPFLGIHSRDRSHQPQVFLVSSLAGDSLCDGHEQVLRGEQDLC